MGPPRAPSRSRSDIPRAGGAQGARQALGIIPAWAPGAGINPTDKSQACSGPAFPAPLETRSDRGVSAPGMGTQRLPQKAPGKQIGPKRIPGGCGSGQRHSPVSRSSGWTPEGGRTWRLLVGISALTRKWEKWPKWDPNLSRLTWSTGTALDEPSTSPFPTSHPSQASAGAGMSPASSHSLLPTHPRPEPELG